MSAFMAPRVPTFGAQATTPGVTFAPLPETRRTPPSESPVVGAPSSDTLELLLGHVTELKSQVATLTAKFDLLSASVEGGAQKARNSKAKQKEAGEIKDASAPTARINAWLRTVIIKDKTVAFAYLRGGNKLFAAQGLEDRARMAVVGSKTGAKKLIPDDADEKTFMTGFATFMYTGEGWAAITDIPKDENCPRALLKAFRAIYDGTGEGKGPAAAYAAFNLQVMV